LSSSCTFWKVVLFLYRTNQIHNSFVRRDANECILRDQWWNQIEINRLFCKCILSFI
jgi:hypothetical protein